MKFFKTTLLLTLLSASVISVYANLPIYKAGQYKVDSSVSLDTLMLTTKNIYEYELQEMLPPSTEDTIAMAKREVILCVSVKASDWKQIDSIEVRISQNEKAGEIKTFKLKYFESNGKAFLFYQNQSFPIINGLAFIEERIPELLLKRKPLITVKALDTTGSYSNTLSKRLN